jgi:opacity protein-like surface antigen
MILFIGLAASLLAVTSNIHAEDADRVVLAPADRFEASLFGSYSGRGQEGAGVGFSFFFDRIIGVSVDAVKENITGSIDEGLNLSASVVLRYPIDSLRLTPYALAGADYNHNRVEVFRNGGASRTGQRVQSDEFNAHAGLGAAFAISKHVSVFAEGRYLLFDAYDHDWSARAGLRFGF